MTPLRHVATRVTRGAFLAVAAAGCGDAIVEPGIEIQVSLETLGDASAGPNDLDYRVELNEAAVVATEVALLPCYDSTARAAFLWFPVAHAHTVDSPTSTATAVRHPLMPSPSRTLIGTLYPPPIDVCAVQVTFAPAEEGVDETARSLRIEGRWTHVDGGEGPVTIEDTRRLDVVVPIEDIASVPAGAWRLRDEVGASIALRLEVDADQLFRSVDFVRHDAFSQGETVLWNLHDALSVRVAR